MEDMEGAYLDDRSVFSFDGPIFGQAGNMLTL
jgi:hypothetical protein